MKKKISAHTKKQSGKLFSLLIFWLLSSATGFAQQAIFSTTFLALTDSSHIDSTDQNVKVVVKNTGKDLYSGYINFYYTTDTIAFTPVQFCTIPSITLNPLQSDTAKCSINFNSTYFQQGENIIIIWSSGNAKTAADSLRDHVYIGPPTADVHDVDLYPVSIYPTLTSDLINIEMRSEVFNNKLFPEAVKITDMFGRRATDIEVIRNGKNKMQLNTSKLNSGIYLLEVYLPSNRRVTAKFIRQ